jgi:hypothetical protein
LSGFPEIYITDFTQLSKTNIVGVLLHLLEYVFGLTRNIVSLLIPVSRLENRGRPLCALTARCPTLNRRGYPLRSKDSLPGGWLTLPGRASHPLEYATLTGRTMGVPYLPSAVPAVTPFVIYEE